MYIVIGRDERQIAYARAEAIAHGEHFEQLHQIKDFSAHNVGERITFRAHGTLKTYGSTMEESDEKGLTPEMFVNDLIKKNLPKTVKVIDLVGCNIGLSRPPEKSYVEKVADLLKANGYDIKINSVTYQVTATPYVALTVFRPPQHGLEIPVPRLMKHNEHIRYIETLGRLTQVTKDYDLITRLCAHAEQLWATQRIIEWHEKMANINKINEDLAITKQNLEVAQKERASYVPNSKSAKASELHRKIEGYQSEIKKIEDSLKEPVADYAVAKIGSKATLTELKEQENMLSGVVKDEYNKAKGIEVLRDMYLNYHDLHKGKTIIKESLDYYNSEKRKIEDNATKLFQPTNAYTDQRVLLDDNLQFCVYEPQAMRLERERLAKEKEENKRRERPKKDDESSPPAKKKNNKKGGTGSHKNAAGEPEEYVETNKALPNDSIRHAHWTTHSLSKKWESANYKSSNASSDDKPALSTPPDKSKIESSDNDKQGDQKDTDTPPLSPRFHH